MSSNLTESMPSGSPAGDRISWRRRARSLVLGLAFLTLGAAADAQDIFVFDLHRDTGRYVLENGRNVTERAGYDNQPFFNADSQSFLYNSMRTPLGDVYEYDLKTGETRQVTDTPDVPEFSPMPDAEEGKITVVRENTSPDQTVWRVDRMSGESEWALSSREPIGYYRFNRRGDALVWVRYAFTMHLFRRGVEGSTFIMGHAAPSTPKLIPGTESFSFVHRQVNGQSWIKRLDPADLSITPVAPTLRGQIYYAWTPDGVLLSADGSVLHQWTPGESLAWSEIVDLADSGLRGITRMRVSPDGTKIAIVAEDEER